MEKKVNAIVLRSADYRDNDKVLSLFSLEEGVLSAGIKGVKKSGARLRFAAQPLSLNEYVLAEKGGRHTVIGASGIDSFYDLRTDIRRFYAAAAAAEFCLAFLPEGIVSPAQFFATADLLKGLCYGKDDPGAAAAKYLAEGLAAAGYAMELGDCGRCGGEIGDRVFFDFDAGAGVCAECERTGDIEMKRSTYAFLGELLCAEYGALPEAAAVTVRKALKFLAYYTEYKTGARMKALAELTGLYLEGKTE